MGNFRIYHRKVVVAMNSCCIFLACSVLLILCDNSKRFMRKCGNAKSCSSLYDSRKVEIDSNVCQAHGKKTFQFVLLLVFKQKTRHQNIVDKNFFYKNFAILFLMTTARQLYEWRLISEYRYKNSSKIVQTGSWALKYTSCKWIKFPNIWEVEPTSRRQKSFISSF